VVGNPSGNRRLPDLARHALARLEELRPSGVIAPRLGVTVDDEPLEKPGESPLSRFAAYEDWDDRAWSAFAIPYAADPRAEDALSRCAARWEQVHLFHGSTVRISLSAPHECWSSRQCQTPPLPRSAGGLGGSMLQVPAIAAALGRRAPPFGAPVRRIALSN